MKFVLYHQEASEPKKFAVLGTQENGTVDIGPEDGAPVVTGVAILDLPKFGHCTACADGEPKSEAPEKKAVKKAHKKTAE